MEAATSAPFLKMQRNMTEGRKEGRYVFPRPRVELKTEDWI